MWSHAVYALRIPHDLFWKLNLRQYRLLCDRHRDELVHREMVGAFTTAAVVNFSMRGPDKMVPPREWMPNYRDLESDSQPVSSPYKAEDQAVYVSYRSQSGGEMAEYKASGIAGPQLRNLGFKDKVFT